MATSSITAPAIRRSPGIAKYFAWSIDHKVIGVQYMVTTFCFFVVGGVLAELMRTDLLAPNSTVLANGGLYNSLFSVHGTVMVFLFVIPMLAGFANYIVPLMIGAKDMAFPWLNAFAFWLIPPAGILLLSGWLIGGEGPARLAFVLPPSGPTLHPVGRPSRWGLHPHLP